ncbi:hypothetical protein ADL34_33115 [Streptomyces sp. NRRL WC-3605]|nr:hypothetical protein ADL34_33115 [Streptomyces sp. NRRL WC-3605]KUL74040.1 hypothetical protein ADL33_18795 [Streptomyces sp. NRRL WC-3604]
MDRRCVKSEFEGSKVTERHSAHCVEEAEEVVKELRAALEKAGITLPTLRIDPASLAREAPCPLVELGRCPVDTARRLAAVLR